MFIFLNVIECVILFIFIYLLQRRRCYLLLYSYLQTSSYVILSVCLIFSILLQDMHRSFQMGPSHLPHSPCFDSYSISYFDSIEITTFNVLWYVLYHTINKEMTEAEEGFIWTLNCSLLHTVWRTVALCLFSVNRNMCEIFDFLVSEFRSYWKYKQLVLQKMKDWKLVVKSKFFLH